MDEGLRTAFDAPSPNLSPGGGEELITHKKLKSSKHPNLVIEIVAVAALPDQLRPTLSPVLTMTQAPWIGR